MQKPTYFNKDADNAINYEAIGMVIGHEMTHGFDDQGRKYDQFGNLTNWWTRGDEESSMRALGLEFMNTIDPSSYWSEPQCKLTLGENIADLGQTLLIRIYLSKKAESDKIDRFTGDQRFIMGLHRVGGNRSGRRLLERL